MSFFRMGHFSLCAAIAAAVCLAISCDRQDRYISITGYAQGGTYMVKLNLRNASGGVKLQPEAIKEGIDSVIAAVDTSLSGYNTESLLTRFNAGERIVPDSIFIDIYRMSYRFYEETGGAFDVASGPLFDIWGFGFREGSFPSAEEVARVKAACGMDRLRPDIGNMTDADGTLALKDLLADDEVEGELPGHDKEEKLLLVCTKGKRAYLLQNRLKYYGYTNTKVLEGGTTFNGTELSTEE